MTTYKAPTASMSGSASMFGSARMYGCQSLTDHMCADRLDGIVSVTGVGSECRTVTAAWDYKRREICARVGCWYGSLEELETRIKPSGAHGWPKDKAAKYRVQYECFIALASCIDEPDEWPEVAA